MITIFPTPRLSVYHVMSHVIGVLDQGMEIALTVQIVHICKIVYACTVEIIMFI